MSLTLTLIQSQLHWEDKTANLRMFEEKISGIREKTEVVVLPEMFSTGFSMKASLLAETVNCMLRSPCKKGSLLREA
jgi:predicted amidohydrolase